MQSIAQEVVWICELIRLMNPQNEIALSQKQNENLKIVIVIHCKPEQVFKVYFQ